MRKTTRVCELELSPDLSLSQVDSFDKLLELREKNDWLLETDDSFFLLKNNVAFRFVKREAKPKLFRTKELWLNPDSSACKIVIEPEELLAFAVKQNVPVFETKEEYIIPSDVCLIAKKPKEKP